MRLFKRPVLLSLLAVFLLAVATIGALYIYYRSQILTSVEETSAEPVAIVFGAGLKADGTPSDILKDRLIVAAELYRAEKVQRILVSGDNSTVNYNEPASMFNYLTTVEAIPSQDVYLDFAGRRTHDTCARAQTVWGIEHAILVTQTFHLPRALLLCAGYGIEAEGISATLQPYLRDDYFHQREWLAFVQAAWQRFIWSPTYIQGSPEEDLDQSLD